MRSDALSIKRCRNAFARLFVEVEGRDHNGVSFAATEGFLFLKAATGMFRAPIKKT
jgi:hypothetical protein